MKPVCFRKFPKLSISRTLILFLLVTILVVSCGENNITTSFQAGSKSSNTINKSIPSSNTIFNTDTSPLNASNITEDIGNLRIQSNDGFQCPYLFYEGGGLIVDQLVLASGRTTYSQSEIKQIIAYMPTLRSIILRSPMPGVKPPPTLRWVSVGSIDLIPGTFPTQTTPCGAALNLINTGNTPIQVPKVSVQLEARPHQNSYQYHLIDACSIIPRIPADSTAYCGPEIGGSGGCNTYFASIQLGPGEKNDVFSSALDVPGCNTLTIAPASQVQLVLQFSLATNTPKNLIYSILPRLTVDTAQGEQTFSLPQLASTLTFASANQFSCYQLHGTTFVLIHPPINLPPQFCV